MESDKDLHDFRVRFEELAEEAAEYGVASVVALSSSNPIAQSEEIAWLSRGSRLTAIGLLTQALWDLQAQTPRDPS